MLGFRQLLSMSAFAAISFDFAADTPPLYCATPLFSAAAYYYCRLAPT
jgi:hypothetical protein